MKSITGVGFTALLALVSLSAQAAQLDVRLDGIDPANIKQVYISYTMYYTTANDPTVAKNASVMDKFPTDQVSNWFTAFNQDITGYQVRSGALTLGYYQGDNKIIPDTCTNMPLNANTQITFSTHGCTIK